jgi:hypothetical protein
MPVPSGIWSISSRSAWGVVTVFGRSPEPDGGVRVMTDAG